MVILTSRFPYPLERGDKLRIYHHIRLLAEQYEIYLLSLSDKPVAEEDIAHVASFCKEVHLRYVKKWDIALSLLKGIMSSLPFQVHYFLRASHREAFTEKITAIDPAVVYCQLLRMVPYAQDLPFPKALDYMDTFSLGMRRRVTNSPWWQRPLLRWEQSRLRAYEKTVFPWFDAHSIISTQDQQALPLQDSSGIEIIPNGVDTDFFQPAPEVQPDQEVVFVGNMGYFPNVEASKLLAFEIVPAVRKRIPCKLLLAGARPSTEVQLLEAEPHVALTGWLDDIRDGYRRGKIFVAPLFAGSGQQNKILEAMSLGMPCIVTSIVNEAIGGEHGKHVLVANSIEEFVESTIQLLEDEQLRTSMGKAARQYVQQTYDWESVGKRVVSFLEKSRSIFLETANSEE